MGLQKDAGDYTGKSGVGKRYLDEYGNFRPITTLPKHIQEEMAANTRKLALEATKARIAKNGAVSEEVISKMPDVQTETLLSIIEKQSDVINRLEGKLDNIVGGASEPKKSNEVKEVEEEAKPLTKKQKLQAEAKELGLAFTESDTIKDLEALIAEENGEAEQEIIAGDDPRFEEKEEEDDL